MKQIFLLVFATSWTPIIESGWGDGGLKIINLEKIMCRTWYEVGREDCMKLGMNMAKIFRRELFSFCCHFVQASSHSSCAWSTFSYCHFFMAIDDFYFFHVFFCVANQIWVMPAANTFLLVLKNWSWKTLSVNTSGRPGYLKTWSRNIQAVNWAPNDKHHIRTGFATKAAFAYFRSNFVSFP